MSDVVANPQTTAVGESKSARKKKAKAGVAAPAVPVQEKTSSEVGSVEPGKTNGVDGGENSYIKELQKQIRNINKKLNAMQKVDAIIEANPGVSLDDLVASRKINADQRASALKKPTLQAQLQQIEEQITQYKKFAQEYEDRIARQKEQLQAAHQEELDKLRETLKEEAAQESRKAFREKLLTLSRFLMAAATRRQTEEGGELSEAFEGALLAVYGGDAAAVTAMENITEGTEDTVVSTQGVPLTITFAQVKQASLAEAPFAAEEAWVDDVAQSQAAPPEAEETTAEAPTEIIAEGQQTGGAAADTEVPSAPAVTSVDAGAANPAAEEQWDKPASGTDEPLAESFEMVPRDPSETETPAAAAPVSSVQSWADDAQEAPAGAPATTAPNDGFSEVHHHRGGRGRGGFHGGYRGRGGPRGGDGRGRGGRGGRGRGDFRGGRGGFRAAPRGGELQPQQQ